MEECCVSKLYKKLVGFDQNLVGAIHFVTRVAWYGGGSSKIADFQPKKLQFSPNYISTSTTYDNNVAL